MVEELYKEPIDEIFKDAMASILQEVDISSEEDELELEFLQEGENCEDHKVEKCLTLIDVNIF